MEFEHNPVLLKEVIEFLDAKNGGTFFDGTLGGGGYAEAILQASPNNKVVGVDIDEDAIRAANERLSGMKERFAAVNDSYSNVARVAMERSARFDGMVLDLGVSSYQFDEGSRGFSFSKEGPLDMRMDVRSERTAADMLTHCSERELEEIFRTYGEERFARKIAGKVVETRNRGCLKTTKDLEEICYVSYPPKLRKGKVHPATRVFQALRIVVNGELENLERFMKEAPDALNEGGRIVIVSYHSLEDRIVKRGFKELSVGGRFKLLTKKPVGPSEEEIEKNPRSRSAKLRAVVKCK